MQLLGARAMLFCPRPRLVYEYWTSEDMCRKLMACETADEVKARADLNWLYCSIWYGSNDYQIQPLLPDGGRLCCNDINIVGDANPSETLWLVFEDDEWNRILPNEVVDRLRKPYYWNEVIKMSGENYSRPLDQLDVWEDSDIISCDKEYQWL